MARAIWTGELIFGRVQIPVRLEGVIEDHSVRAHLVHRKDHGRLQLKRFCKKCGHEIDWGDAARAVEVGRREVVDFEPEELKALKVERENDIALSSFTDPAAVDPAYFDRTYALVPIGKEPRAFELVAELLRKTGKIAVTRVSLSGRSYPAVIRARGAELVLHTLHYGDEVREARGRSDVKLKPSAREVDLASQLVERMSIPFDPSQTQDPYRLAVEEIAAGRKPRPIDEDAARRKKMEENAEVLDLMSALQRSLKEKPDRGSRSVRTAARTAGKGRRAEPRGTKSRAEPRAAKSRAAKTPAAHAPSRRAAG